MKKARNNPEWWEKAMANAAIEGLMDEHDSDMHFECQTMNERCIYELRKVYWRNVFEIEALEVYQKHLLNTRPNTVEIDLLDGNIGSLAWQNKQILSQIKQLQPVGRKMCGEFKQSKNEIQTN